MLKLNSIALQRQLTKLLSQCDASNSERDVTQNSLQTDCSNDSSFAKKTQNVKLLIGFSGGLDSTVLLHVLSQLQTSHSNQHSDNEQDTYSFSIKAVHVDHQLQAESNAWSQHCSEFCQTYGVEFESVKVSVDINSGKGVEAAAREARYAVFRDKLNEGDILLTAHHLDDQIETVLLKLLRGTGLQGAGGIREVSQFNSFSESELQSLSQSKLPSKSHYLLRPLLIFTQQDLQQYVDLHQLNWIDDPSNVQLKYDRNYLRHQVLPLIEKRWPSYRHTISRFSQHSQSANKLLKDYTAEHFASVFDENLQTLNTIMLLTFKLEQQHQIIRYWISALNFPLPTEQQLLQICQMSDAVSDATPIVKWHNAEIRRYQSHLYLFKQNSFPEFSAEALAIENWDITKSIEIPGIGELFIRSVRGEGISPEYFTGKIKIRFRIGGERCFPKKSRTHRSLKKILQENNVPPWQRQRIPLICIDDDIAAVTGLFDCQPYAVNSTDFGWQIYIRTPNEK